MAKKITITNAFSINMLSSMTSDVSFTEISLTKAKQLAFEGSTSAIGHADMAIVFGNLLDKELPVNRTSIAMYRGDEILVGQYSGPRLPEGATTLPEGAAIRWVVVRVM